MGVYVDVDDIRQHFRASGAFDDEIIEEIMAEQEAYVQRRLKLSSLPPDNKIISNIVRDLTIAQGIFTLLPAGSPDFEKANNMRSEALRRLVEVEGAKGSMLRPDNTSAPTNTWENEVINPFPTPFFTPEMFEP